MTKLDVRASRDSIQEAEDAQEEMFEMDEDETATSNQKMACKEAERLDILMDDCLRYIYAVCHPQGGFI